MPKNLITYSLITFFIISFFGLNFMISFLGNILILLFLTPILLIGIFVIGINLLKQRFSFCENCGSTILSNSENCIYCGYKLKDTEKIQNFSNDASKETVEIEAEEIN